MQKEVADLRAKVQAHQATQRVLLDILSTYEAKFGEEDGLGIGFGDSSSSKWWEAGDDDATNLSSGGSGGGGSGGDGTAATREGGEGATATAAAEVVRRLERFCQSMAQALEEKVALTGQLERSLADCVCSNYS